MKARFSIKSNTHKIKHTITNGSDWVMKFGKQLLIKNNYLKKNHLLLKKTEIKRKNRSDHICLNITESKKSIQNLLYPKSTFSLYHLCLTTSCPLRDQPSK